MNQTPAEIAALKAYRKFRNLSPQDRVIKYKEIYNLGPCKSCTPLTEAVWETWNTSWEVCNTIWTEPVYVVF